MDEATALYHDLDPADELAYNVAHMQERAAKYGFTPEEAFELWGHGLPRPTPAALPDALQPPDPVRGR